MTDTSTPPPALDRRPSATFISSASDMLAKQESGEAPFIPQWKFSKAPAPNAEQQRAAFPAANPWEQGGGLKDKWRAEDKSKAPPERWGAGGTEKDFVNQLRGDRATAVEPRLGVGRWREEERDGIVRPREPNRWGAATEEELRWNQNVTATRATQNQEYRGDRWIDTVGRGRGRVVEDKWLNPKEKESWLPGMGEQEPKDKKDRWGDPVAGAGANMEQGDRWRSPGHAPAGESVALASRGRGFAFGRGRVLKPAPGAPGAAPGADTWGNQRYAPSDLGSSPQSGMPGGGYHRYSRGYMHKVYNHLLKGSDGHLPLPSNAQIDDPDLLSSGETGLNSEASGDLKQQLQPQGSGALNENANRGNGTTATYPVVSAQAFAADAWVYKDPQGVVQGPFTKVDILEWFEAGFFPPDLPIKSHCDPAEAPFVPLSTMMKMWAHIGAGRAPPGFVPTSPAPATSAQPGLTANAPLGQAATTASASPFASSYQSGASAASRHSEVAIGSTVSVTPNANVYPQQSGQLSGLASAQLNSYTVQESQTSRSHSLELRTAQLAQNVPPNVHGLQPTLLSFQQQQPLQAESTAFPSVGLGGLNLPSSPFAPSPPVPRDASHVVGRDLGWQDSGASSGVPVSSLDHFLDRREEPTLFSSFVPNSLSPDLAGFNNNVYGVPSNYEQHAIAPPQPYNPSYMVPAAWNNAVKEPNPNQGPSLLEHLNSRVGDLSLASSVDSDALRGMGSFVQPTLGGSGVWSYNHNGPTLTSYAPPSLFNNIPTPLPITPDSSFSSGVTPMKPLQPQPGYGYTPDFTQDPVERQPSGSVVQPPDAIERPAVAPQQSQAWGPPAAPAPPSSKSLADIQREQAAESPRTKAAALAPEAPQAETPTPQKAQQAKAQDNKAAGKGAAKTPEPAAKQPEQAPADQTGFQEIHHKKKKGGKAQAAEAEPARATPAHDPIPVPVPVPVPVAAAPQAPRPEPKIAPWAAVKTVPGVISLRDIQQEEAARAADSPHSDQQPAQEPTPPTNWLAKLAGGTPASAWPAPPPVARTLREIQEEEQRGRPATVVLASSPPTGPVGTGPGPRNPTLGEILERRLEGGAVPPPKAPAWGGATRAPAVHNLRDVIYLEETVADLEGGYVDEDLSDLLPPPVVPKPLPPMPAPVPSPAPWMNTPAAPPQARTLREIQLEEERLAKQKAAQAAAAAPKVQPPAPAQHAAHDDDAGLFWDYSGKPKAPAAQQPPAPAAKLAAAPAKPAGGAPPKAAAAAAAAPPGRSVWGAAPSSVTTAPATQEYPTLARGGPAPPHPAPPRPAAANGGGVKLISTNAAPTAKAAAPAAPPSRAPQNSQQPDLGMFPADNDAALFAGELQMSADFKNWCRKMMQEFFGNDDLTLIEFLMNLQSRSEVAEYCQIYIGNKTGASTFVAEFLKRKDAEMAKASGKGKKKKNAAAAQAAAAPAAAAPQHVPKPPPTALIPGGQPADGKHNEGWNTIPAAQKKPAKKNKKGKKLDPNMLGFTSEFAVLAAADD